MNLNRHLVKCVTADLEQLNSAKRRRPRPSGGVSFQKACARIPTNRYSNYMYYTYIHTYFLFIITQCADCEMRASDVRAVEWNRVNEWLCYGDSVLLRNGAHVVGWTSGTKIDKYTSLPLCERAHVVHFAFAFVRLARRGQIA